MTTFTGDIFTGDYGDVIREEEEYVLSIQEWLTGVKNAIKSIKAGVALTETDIQHLEGAFDSLCNTWQEELEEAEKIKKQRAQNPQ